MHHLCPRQTNLDELIGIECCEGQRLAVRYGPQPLAMTAGEELVLENSNQLAPILLAKLPSLIKSLLIEETAQTICPRPGFRIALN